MPASTGEPFRGLAYIRLTAALGGEYRFYLTTAASGTPLVADQTTWDADAGASMPLRLVKNQAATNAAVTPTHYRVQVLIAGTPTVIDSVTGRFSTAITEDIAIPFTLDALPLQATVEAARAGLLETRLQIWRDEDNSGTQDVNDWGVVTPVDSAGNGAPGTGATFSEWARGYVRSRLTLTSHGLSNVALGGAQPTTFAYPDAIYSRAVMTELYSVARVTHSLGSGDGVTTYRTLADANSIAATRDATFDATAAASDARRVDSVAGTTTAAFPAAASTPTVRLTLPTGTTFDETPRVWSATPPTGWTRQSDTVMARAAALTVDPRVSFTGLMQLNDNTFGTPPSSKDAGSARLSADLGFVAARVLNVRGEGINQAGGASLGISYSLYDDGGLVTPKTAVDQATQTRGGEAGWGPLMAWEAGLPRAGWTNAVTFRDAAGVQGTASIPYTLLATDPRVIVTIGGGSQGDQANHFTPGDTFIAGLSCAYADTGHFCDVDANSAFCALTRLNLATGRAQTFDGTGWIDMSDAQPAVWHAMGPSPGDPAHVFTKSFTVTATWEMYDAVLIGRVRIGGTPYGNFMQVPVVGDANQHAGYEFDVVGFR